MARATEKPIKMTAGDIVKAYVEERPSLFVYFINGLINVNALARKVREDTGTEKNEGALVVALHRLAEEVTSGYINRKHGERAIAEPSAPAPNCSALRTMSPESLSAIRRRRHGREQAAMEKFLADTDINVYSNYAVAVFEGHNHVDAEVKISFGKKTIVVGKRNALERYKPRADYYRDGLAVVEFVHPEGAEDLPGVVFRIYWRFFEKNISIIETFSAWNVTYVVVRMEDLKKVTGLFL